MENTEAIQEVQEQQPEINEGQVQQVNEQDVSDWTKDQKYEKVWKKDPNQLYKSYNESQKQWHTFYQPLSGVLKEYKIKNAEELKSFFYSRKDFDVLKQNEDNFLALWNHQTYGPKLQNLFREIESEQSRLQNDPIYQNEIRLKQLETQLAKYAEKERFMEGQSKLDSGLSELGNMAKQYGLKSYNETKFLQELHDNDVPIDKIKTHFIEKFLPEIIKGEKAKVEQGIAKNLKNNANGSILSTDKQTNKKEDYTWDVAMKQLLGS